MKLTQPAVIVKRIPETLTFLYEALRRTKSFFLAKENYLPSKFIFPPPM